MDNGELFTKAWGSLTNDKYCLDVLHNDTLSAFICYSEPSPEQKAVITLNKLNTGGMIISMPFLLLTFIAYALLPDRNLHKKALMCYVITLFAGYLCLVIINLSSTSFENTTCKAFGYSAVFFFMVSFFWMNAICIDLWLSFSGLRGYMGGRKHSENKRFIIYSAYAWGMPILHEIIVIAIDESTPSSETNQVWYDPGVGVRQCFFSVGYPELLYFYGPMAILILINIILFSITAIRIRSLKKDTSVLKKDDSRRHTYENDKRKFNLYVKLFIAMGVNWSMEIISWAVIWQVPKPTAYVWYLTDFCNATYGVFIFFFFVFKRSIWKLLKKRYYAFIGKTYFAHSMTTNQRITATSYSTGHTSLPPDSRTSGLNADNTYLTSTT